jgi:hypothetical protein
VAITYASQGDGVSTETSSAALSPLCPATVTAGQILIAHVFWEGTTSAPSDPSGWTPLSGPHVIETTIARHWVYGRIADGSEDGSAVAFGAPAVTTQRAARIYSFNGRVSGAIADLVRGFAPTSHATDPQMPSVTTTVAGSLAVALVAQNDNNAFASPTGESGGDWVEGVAEYTVALTPGLSLGIQTAAMASVGTISGGSMATTNDPCGVIAFEIRDSVPATNFNSTGALAVQSAAIAGDGVVGRTSTGALAAQAAAISGTGIVGRTSTGALAVQSAAVAGESTVGRVSTGELLAQSSVIDGAAEVAAGETNDFPATGDLVAQSSTVSGDGIVGRVSTGDLISQSATMTAESTVARVGTGELISQDSVIAGSGTSSAIPEVAEVVERAKSSPRKRYRIIEDPDLLQEELRVEEKKVEVEKKKLRILIKRVESPNVEGVLYQQIQEKIEKLEAKIDDRLEKIAGLMLAIQVGLDEQDDEEEEIFLLS